MKFHENYEFHNDGIYNLVFFLFLLSEFINISWWINFQIHLQTWVSGLREIKLNESQEEPHRNSLSRVISSKFNLVKKKEIIELLVLIFLFLLYWSWNIFGIVLSYVRTQCSSCHPFYKYDQTCQEPKWKFVVDIYNYTFQGLCLMTVIIVILKVLVGVRLLILMRHNLYMRYKKRRKGIIFTIVFSCITILLRALYNFYDEFRKWDLRYNFTARMGFPSYIAPLQFLLSVIEDTLPIAVMLLNLKTINFKVYLLELINAWSLQSFTKEASIFLFFNKKGVENYSIMPADEITDTMDVANLLVEDSEDVTSIYNDDYKSNYEEISRMERRQITMQSSRDMSSKQDFSTYRNSQRYSPERYNFQDK